MGKMLYCISQLRFFFDGQFQRILGLNRDKFQSDSEAHKLLKGHVIFWMRYADDVP